MLLMRLELVLLGSPLSLAFYLFYKNIKVSDVDWAFLEQEPDVEELEFVCFFDDTVFSNIHSMLHHCKDAHQFDLVQVQENLRELLCGMGR